MVTIEATHGAQYEVLYALRRKGGVKNELVTKEMEVVLEYLCRAHQCQEKDLKISDKKRAYMGDG